MGSPIDGIGGGGGGGFNILDPLGLGGIVSGLIGGLEKALKGPDMASTAQVGQQMMNKVGSFDAAASTAGSSMDPAQQPATTEFVPPKDPAAADAGYQQTPEQDAPVQAPSVDQRESSSFAATATQSEPTPQDQSTAGQRGQSSSAATGVVHDSSEAGTDPKKELAALMPLAAYANAIDHYGVGGDINDGLFNRDSLTNVANDSNLPQELRDSAQYVLDHPKLMQTLQIATAKGDGSISTAKVAEYIGKLEGAPSTTQTTQTAQTTQTTQTTQPAPVTKLEANPGVITLQQSSRPTEVPPGGQAGPAGGTHKNDGSLNGIVDTLDRCLNSIRKEMNDAVNTIATSKDPDKVRAAQTQLTLLNQDMQMIMEQRKAMFELISNLAKAFNDMQMHAIGKIG